MGVSKHGPYHGPEYILGSLLEGLPKKRPLIFGSSLVGKEGIGPFPRPDLMRSDQRTADEGTVEAKLPSAHLCLRRVGRMETGPMWVRFLKNPWLEECSWVLVPKHIWLLGLVWGHVARRKYVGKHGFVPKQ